MNNNKIIAQAEWKFFGGNPKVLRYWNDNKTRQIDILCCKDVPDIGVQSCASIGLNAVDIGLMSGQKQLRVEILAASDIKNKSINNILASVSFEIMRTMRCYPGYITSDVISQYIEGTDMKYILLTDPFIWQDAKSIIVDDLCVAWLLMVPISKEELEYAYNNGIDALEKLFEEEDIDIYNIYRDSIL